MSTSPEPSPVNGHSSPDPNNVSVQLLDPEPSDSDSDLSDAPAPDLGSPSASQDELDDTAGNGRVDDFEDPQTSSDEEEDAPNDGDFDDAGDAASLASNGDGDQVEAVSSDNSSTRSKRKLAVNFEDEYMRENPELYGLRRSVSCRSSALPLEQCANPLLKSRPQQRRKIVSLPSPPLVLSLADPLTNFVHRLKTMILRSPTPLLPTDVRLRSDAQSAPYLVSSPYLVGNACKLG